MLKNGMCKSENMKYVRISKLRQWCFEIDSQYKDEFDFSMSERLYK